MGFLVSPSLRDRHRDRSATAKDRATPGLAFDGRQRDRDRVQVNSDLTVKVLKSDRHGSLASYVPTVLYYGIYSTSTLSPPPPSIESPEEEIMLIYPCHFRWGVQISKLCAVVEATHRYKEIFLMRS